MTVDWSLCHWPACVEECRDGPKIDCPAVLAWREKKDDTMTDISKEAVERLAAKLHTDGGYESAAQIAAATPLSTLPSAIDLEDIDPDDVTLGDYPIVLGQGDYPTVREITDRDRWLMCDAAATLRAQAARIAELEADAIKTRGYRVGHIAGLHAGIRAAAKWHREVARHDEQGMEYSSLVGIPISNWDDLDTSVKTHEWCEREILSLLAKDTSHDG